MRSEQTGVLNGFAVPVDGGEPVQLTNSTTESIIVQSYFPADGRFLYLSDQGGNELNHLYVQGEDGAVTDLTPGENLKAEFHGWAQNDKTLFVGTNERDPKYFDLYEMAADGYERTLLYKDETGYAFLESISLNHPVTRQLNHLLFPAKVLRVILIASAVSRRRGAL